MRPPRSECLPAARCSARRRSKSCGAGLPPGAAWPDHWAYRPLIKPPPPSINDPWPQTPIDSFILAKLARRGLSPAPPADKRTLIRRVTFDLIGLPPTPEEIDAFLADKSPDAYEKVVDRLLASPHYGERWARHWMDVVHFAETHGHDQDRPRAKRLALPRLPDPLVQRRQALRPLRRRSRSPATCSFPTTRTATVATRLSRRRAVGRKLAARHPRRHHRPQDRPLPRPRRHGDDGDVHVRQHDGPLRPLPRPQVRPDHAGGLLRACRPCSPASTRPTASTTPIRRSARAAASRPRGCSPSP